MQFVSDVISISAKEITESKKVVQNGHDFIILFSIKFCIMLFLFFNFYFYHFLFLKNVTSETNYTVDLP